MAEHRAVLANVKTGVLLAELVVDQLDYSDGLHGAGAASVKFPITQPTAAATVPLITRANLTPWRHSLYILRDEVPMWSGIISSRVTAPSSGSISISAVGWLGYLRRRLRQVDRTYTTTDQLTIARGIINDAQNVSGGDVRITTTDTNTAGINRTRIYLGAERKPFGEALEQLAAVQTGFDFRFETLRDSNGDIEVAFRTAYPAGGRATSHVLEHGATCAVVDLDEDADDLANSITASGAFDTEQVLLLSDAFDVAALNSYPLLEAAVPFSDVSVQGTLDDHAARELARRKDPTLRIEAELLDGISPSLGEYIIGDLMRVIYADGFDDIDATMRVIGSKTTVLGDSELTTLSMVGAL